MALRRMDRGEFARVAELLATSFNLVYYQDNFYIPEDLVTEQFGMPGPNSVWHLQQPWQLFRFANQFGDILFENDAQRRSYLLLLEQFSEQIHEPVHEILVRKDGQLALLDGTTVKPTTGSFVPNYIRYEVGQDQTAKDWVFERIAEWVSSPDDAHSLLNHFATILSPGWSAGKLVLLIGGGSNGKSTLLKMVEKLLGKENISGVTRQMMAERSPAIHEINGRLLNLVFDAERGYLKDSSVEKTLIVGEPLHVRMLFSSDLTRVQSNCLFVEGLNSEPKAADKSFALQRRISRYYFPNIYADDESFLRRCLCDESISALLALLLEHYVNQDEKSAKLKATTKSNDMAVDYNLLNSPVHQYVEHLIKLDNSWIQKFESGRPEMDPIISGFMNWRLGEGLNALSSADAIRLFRDDFEITWTSRRVNGKPVKYRVLDKPRSDMVQLLTTLKG